MLNLWRNKFLSIATIISIAIILFIFNIIVAVYFITESSLQSLSEKVDMVLYLNDNFTTEQRDTLIKEVKLIDGVTNVSYTSKDDALTKVQSMYPDIYQSFDKYDLKNPLPASISVKTKDPKIQKDIENYISGSKFRQYISNISNVTDQNQGQDASIISSVAKNLEKVTDFSRQIIFWIVIIFLIGGMLIILNSVQMAIFTRRKEIEIMRLVGAKHMFIKLPFIIEGIFHALGAVIINILMLQFLAGKTDLEISKNLNFISLSVIEFIVTVILATCSSLIAVHNHIRKNI